MLQGSVAEPKQWMLTKHALTTFGLLTLTSGPVEGATGLLWFMMLNSLLHDKYNNITTQ